MPWGCVSMDSRMVNVPVALLLGPDLAASAKVVWMALRLKPDAEPPELETLTGLSRHTIERGLSRCHCKPGGPRVTVPAALLADRRVAAQGKVLFGLLQTTPGFRRQEGQFTYGSLCALTRLGRNTLKRAMAELATAGWARTTQATRLSPIRFTLGNPDQTRSVAEAETAARRLKRAKNKGEAIMQEYLSLLIDSDQFTDNARPGFLVSPLTGERLELDRFYPPSVAFEFNGAQHYHETPQVSQAEVEAQRMRDLIKAGICLYRSIHLVIIHAEDLSLQAMTRKIGKAMPLRSLEGHEPLIDFLENASVAYCASAPAAR